jgi:transaldolase
VEPSKESLDIKIFADGADLAGMIEMASKPYISGLTTNPTLMRKAGIIDYVAFAKTVIKEIPNKSISFEVFSDSLDEMIIQAEEIASWGQNVFVKIPVTNTLGLSTTSVVKKLSEQGVKVNVTAVMTSLQVQMIIDALNPNYESYISVFAGRIADTGRDPMPIMEESLRIISSNQNAKLIWASPRELLNVFQADSIGCHIITATNDILKKLDLVGKDLEHYSLETVQMFRKDAIDSAFKV